MNRLDPLRAVVLTVLLATASGLSAATLVPVEAPSGAVSLAPRLASTEGSRAVLSWLDVTDTGHRFMLSEFDGGRFGPARTVAEGDRFFANWADTPGIQAGHQDLWLAHWLLRSGRGSYAYDIAMATSEDRGRTWSAPFSPHDDGTLTEHGFVSTYLDPESESESGLGAVWLDGRETEPAAEDRPENHGAAHHHGSGSMTLRSAVVRFDGGIEGASLLDDRVCDCCSTDTALTADGAVVVYRDRSVDEIRDIALIRRSEQGWSEPITVHPDGWRISACPVNGPAVLARGNRVMVAWFTMAEDLPRVRLALSDDGGHSFDQPISLDPGIALGRVDLAWKGEQFVLSWLAETASGAALRIARFDAGGAMIDRHDLTTLDKGRISGVPRLLGLGDDRLLLSWTEAAGEPARPRVRAGLVHFERIRADAAITDTAGESIQGHR